MCVSCLRTSCLVPSDFRPGSRDRMDRQAEEKGGREQEEEGFSLSDGRKMGGWVEVVEEEGGECVRREYVKRLA